MKELKIPQAIKENPKLLRFVADILQDIYPNLSYCERCGLPWNACQSKSVPMIRNKSTFAVCTDCWKISTLVELQKYHAKVYRKQSEQGKMEYSLLHAMNQVQTEFEKTKDENISHILRGFTS